MNFDFEHQVMMYTEGLLGTAPVDTGHWQALEGVPQTKTYELINAQLVMHLPPGITQAEQIIQPNMPFAEAQFQDRVSGLPLNPPPSHKLWPWYRHNAQHQKDEKFSHSYPERFWPKHANCGPEHGEVRGGVKRWREGPMTGIRYEYGDLDDVVELLVKYPTTRQAYLPVFFPEDTGAHHGERIPCTLGYHFMMRHNWFHMWYDIRSCDFMRHFRDDVYMAVRLGQWVLAECQHRDDTAHGTELHNGPWASVQPGIFHMNMHSLHCFEGDLPKLRRLHDAAQA